MKKRLLLITAIFNTFFAFTYEGYIFIDITLEMKSKFKPDEALVYTAPYSRKPAPTIEISPVLVGNTIYIGYSDGHIYGIHREDGTMKRKCIFSVPVFCSAAVSGNTLIMADYEGTVYAFTEKYLFNI